MTKKLFFYLFILLTTLSTFNEVNAQSKTFDGVLKARLQNMGPIINDKVVEGYYMFYEVDKVDRKKREYLLQILDANLNVLGSKKIIDSKHVTLLEATYNGVNIMMKFYDRKAKSIDFRTYNKSAERVYTKSRKLEKKWELAPYASVAQGKEITNKTLFPIQGQGFIEYSLYKPKKFGYKIKFFPNEKGVKGWTKKSKADASLHEIATFVGANDQAILSLVTKNKSRLSTKNISTFLMAINAKTGKKIFEKELKDTKYELAVLNAYLKEDGSGEIAVLGQFYKKGASTLKDKSLGLFSFFLDKDGKVVNKNYAKWEKDVGKFVESTSQGKLKNVGYIYFHEIVQAADGKIFAIGETFRKAADGLGIASNILSGGRSNMSVVKIKIKDMAIFEFSPSFELQDVKFYEKSSSDVSLGQGQGMTKVMLLGRMIDQLGYFDYSFTQRSRDNSEFLIGYLDYERKKGAKNELVFGALAYADGEMTTDKISLGRRLGARAVFPAKPGYIMLVEYLRKEKKLDLSLEKVNY